MKNKQLALILAATLVAAGYYFYKNQALSRLPVIKLEWHEGAALTVDGKPYFVRGVCYSPVPPGKDYEYNFWGDPHKPWLTDGPMMKAMGVNTVRFYRAGKNPAEVKQVLDDLYKKFGIRVLMGHYLGFWDWPPPNYADKEFREKIRTQVLEMVRLYKDNPAVLMWVLGNENNYSFDMNIQRWTTDELDAITDPDAQRLEKARIYYSFVNSLAQDIKKIDARHPVVLGNGETRTLEVAGAQCPDIDVVGMIAYRGPGFGSLYRQVVQKFDKPVVMIEFGADSFSTAGGEPDEDSQAEFLNLQWQDIQRNVKGGKGAGSSLGGTVFEWSDEWWKGNENLPSTWNIHDTAGHWRNVSYHTDAYGADPMNMNEEWWGVVSLDPQKKANGLAARMPKKSYQTMRSIWKNSKSD